MDGLIYCLVKVYEFNVNIDGFVSRGNEVFFGYSVDLKGNVIFNGIIDLVYCFVYEIDIDNSVKLSEGGNMMLMNKVVFSGDNLEFIFVEVIVVVKYGKMIVKLLIGYDGEF